MAWTWSSKNVDPIAYRAEEQQNAPVTETTQNWQFDPAKLKNADVNLSAYWDDSSETNYNNPDLWWGENAKYKWAETKNTSIAYDKNATLENLNPNYAYGQKAQMVNSSDAWYIQRRNDQIASALYNAWKVSEQDVSDFLYQQEWFKNSTANERANTIKSVWKRLWEISSNGNQNENKTDTTSKTENDAAAKNMESDLLQSTAWELYGKNTADWRGEDRAIKTLEDEYNVQRRVNEQRISNFKSLQSMSSSDIAASIVSWYTPYWDQGMRDLMQYDPNKYDEIQTKIKELKAQNTINSITKWEEIRTESDIAKENIENENKRQAETYASSETEVSDLINSVDTDLASNQAANTAEWTMDNISADMEKLKTRLKNLDLEASKVFKSDVPQYLINAYKSNRTKEIQDKLSELESRYNAAYDRYKTELDNTWKEKEYNLQLMKFKQDQDEFEWKKQTASLDNFNISWQDWIPYQIEKTSTWIRVRQLSTAEWMADLTDLKANRTEVVKTLTSIFSNATSLEDIWYLVGEIKEWVPWWQCWYFGNNLSSAMWSNVKFGSKLSEKLNPQWDYTKSKTPVVGSFAVFNSKKYPENWHVGMVTSVNDDWSFTVVSSNNWGDEQIFYADYAAWSALTFIVPKATFNGWNNNYYEDMEVPSSIYEVWYRTVDPKSEEGKRLREQYIKNNQPISSTWNLVADADWKNTAAFKVISSDWETPIDFRQRIYNLVPSTLKNSDAELKNLYEVAKDLYKAWYTADEASMVFYGLDPRSDNTGLLKPLIYYARMSGKDLPETFYGSLWGLLEAWNTNQAVRLIENSVMNEKEMASEQKAIALVSKIQQLENLINNTAYFQKAWYAKKTLDSFINKYAGTNTELAQVAADMQNIYWQIRNELLGSNMTQSELKLYQWMIPDIKDPINNLKSKLKSTKKSTVENVNWVRALYDLPLLDENTLVNVRSRVNLYQNADTSNTDETDWS